MLCVKCGKVTDINDIGIEEIRSLVGARVEIVDHTTIVYVACEDCIAGAANFIDQGGLESEPI